MSFAENLVLKIPDSLVSTDARGRRYMQKQFLAKAVDGLTDAYGGWVTPPIDVGRFATGVFVFQFAYADATSVQVQIETSEDDGLTWAPWPDQGSGTAGVYTQKPRVDSFLAADEALGIGTEATLGTKLLANMNSTADQAITITAPSDEYGLYQITRIVASAASQELNLADGGIYPTTAKGGVPIVPAAQVYTALVLPSDTLELTISDASLAYGLGTIYLSLTGAEGSAATATFTVFGVAAQAHELAFELGNVRLIRAKVKHTGGTNDAPMAQVFFMGGR